MMTCNTGLVALYYGLSWLLGGHVFYYYFRDDKHGDDIYANRTCVFGMLGYLVGACFDNAPCAN